MGEKHRYREKPDIITVSTCGKPKRTVAKIPFGKRYFECDPCNNHLVCNPLTIKSSTVQELRDLWRIGCCPKCK